MLKGHQSSPEGGVRKDEEEGWRGWGGPASEGACVKGEPEEDSPRRQQGRQAAGGPRFQGVWAEGRSAGKACGPGGPGGV